MYNRDPVNIKKRCNIALGMDDFPDLPSKKMQDTATVTTTASTYSSHINTSTYSSQSNTTTSRITRAKLVFLDSKLTSDLKTFKVDIQAQTNALTMELKSDLDNIVSKKTAKSLVELKAEMNKDYNNHTMKQFDTQMTNFQGKDSKSV
eukprot:27336-Ditylum_brightwellii.AAC.1